MPLEIPDSEDDWYGSSPIAKPSRHGKHDADDSSGACGGSRYVNDDTDGDHNTSFESSAPTKKKPRISFKPGPNQEPPPVGRTHPMATCSNRCTTTVHIGKAFSGDHNLRPHAPQLGNGTSLSVSTVGSKPQYHTCVVVSRNSNNTHMITVAKVKDFLLWNTLLGRAVSNFCGVRCNAITPVYLKGHSSRTPVPHPGNCTPRQSSGYPFVQSLIDLPPGARILLVIRGIEGLMCLQESFLQFHDVYRHLRIILVIQVEHKVDPDSTLFDIDKGWKYLTVTLKTLVDHLLGDIRDAKCAYLCSKLNDVVKSKAGLSEASITLSLNQSKGRNTRIPNHQETALLLWCPIWGCSRGLYSYHGLTLHFRGTRSALPAGASGSKSDGLRCPHPDSTTWLGSSGRSIQTQAEARVRIGGDKTNSREGTSLPALQVHTFAQITMMILWYWRR